MENVYHLFDVFKTTDVVFESITLFSVFDKFPLHKLMIISSENIVSIFESRFSVIAFTFFYYGFSEC